MERKLVNSDSDGLSAEALSRLYGQLRIPAEKKPFLISLRDSSGPLMVTRSGAGILDVASQIASHGLGFNPGVLFGTTEFLEAWTGSSQSEIVATVRRAFAGLLADRAGWSDLHLHLCHSGAEANEIAIGMCFHHRRCVNARRIIAFRQAFHGRMMVSLTTTWSPAKREPFSWPGYETTWADYPEMMDSDDVAGTGPPEGWQEIWSTAPRADFESRLKSKYAIENDRLLASEVNSLLDIRAALAGRQHFAVIVEPMQCEGGDRYSSARFHNGLVALCRSYDVPLIYDEIQTGFALGGDFFWHRKFNLRDAEGKEAFPDYVVLAKKAQLGTVMAHHPSPFPEEFNVASLIRGFAHGSMVDQYQEEIALLEHRNREELGNLVDEFGPSIVRPRASGLSFAFDFADSEMAKRFVARRFRHGLLYYPAGEASARFRLSLAFRGEVLDIAWQQIRAALLDTLRGGSDTGFAGMPEVIVDVAEPQPYQEYHCELIRGKLAIQRGESPRSMADARAFVQQSLRIAGLDNLAVQFIDRESWPGFREGVERLQEEIYEPLRQTAIEKFDALVEAAHSLAIIITDGEKIVGIAFSAPPANFPNERGLKSDPLFHEPLATYMLDLTVVADYQGALGRILKQAVCLVAQTMGLRWVVGRNRDRLARGMWAINLSLGSYCTRVLRDDYPDSHHNRDCLMYRCDLNWDEGPIELSRGVEQPLDAGDVELEFVRAAMPSIVNKLTLSNWLSPEAAEDLSWAFGLLPDSLRHGYTASGISECVDKLVKVFWLKRKPRTGLVVIGDGWFGGGSFMARALSGVHEAFFPVVRLDANAEQEIAVQLRRHLELCNAETAQEPLAVWIEPLGWKSGVRLKPETLVSIGEVCRQFGVPLISHDSAGAFFRYTTDAFLPSGLAGFAPDAGMLSMGGQMAICYTSAAFFDATPLQLISTWDGDEFSLARFCKVAREVTAGRSVHESMIQHFQDLLLGKLAENGVSKYDFDRGAGWFEGPVEKSLGDLFEAPLRGRRVCLPAPGAMRRFVERHAPRVTSSRPAHAR
jgi:4-aminobutyrate aminotransferase-like enzyme